MTSTTINLYRVGIRTCSDYSPFGVELDGRTVSGGYRFGFNGKEKTDEISGIGNSYDFGSRIFDSKLVKFLSRDPKEAVYPYQSSYCYAANNPILYVDENGEGPILGWMCKYNKYNKDSNCAQLGYKINVSRTIYVVNSSKMGIPAEAKSAICTNIQSDYRNSSFSYDLTANETQTFDDFMDRQLPSSIPDNASLKINVEIQFYATVQFVNSLDEITDLNATIMEIVDDIPASANGINPVGIALGDAIKVESENISPRDINLNGFSLIGKNVSIHEILHLDGASDLYSFSNGKLVQNHSSRMGTASSINYALANKTKSEIANYYFGLTRMANDLESANTYPAQKVLGILDIPGKHTVKIDDPNSTNKKDLKNID